MLPITELQKQPLFSWIPAEAYRTFEACFDMEAEELPAGETRNSSGRIGYLLSGELYLENGRSSRAGPGEIFGILHAADGHARMEKLALTARRTSVVIWMNQEIMTSVCYFDCWFHGRFITEMQKYLSAQYPESPENQV